LLLPKRAGESGAANFIQVGNGYFVSEEEEDFDFRAKFGRKSRCAIFLFFRDQLPKTDELPT
jgi:hypothetical protein